MKMKKALIFTGITFVVLLAVTFGIWKSINTLTASSSRSCEIKQIQTVEKGITPVVSQQKHSAAYEWIVQNPNGNFCEWKTQNPGQDLFTWEKLPDPGWSISGIISVSVLGIGSLVLLILLLGHFMADQEVKNRIIGKKGTERTITLTFYAACIVIGLLVKFFKWDAIDNALTMVFIAACGTIVVVNVMILKERYSKSKRIIPNT